MKKRKPARDTSTSTRPEGHFEDGFGLRVPCASGRDTLERLYLDEPLRGQESAVRERVARLSNFRHVRFARLRSVEKDGTGESRLVYIVADQIDGLRLCDVVAIARSEGVTLDVNVALQLVREILPALSVLHDSRNVPHGAIGLDRLVLPHNGRVVLVDHGLGLAIEKLKYPRTRLWKDFRIPMPPTAGLPRFDARSDVGAVAIVLLELLLQRPLTLNEFPDGLRKLLDSLQERTPTGGIRALSAPLRAWLERALPAESRRPFSTALEAQVALEDAVKAARAYVPAPSAAKAFGERIFAVQARAGYAGPDVVPADEATALVIRLTEVERAPRVVLEEEEAEEIRRLEAELARLALLEPEREATAPEAAAEAPSPASQVGQPSPQAEEFDPDAPVTELVVPLGQADVVFVSAPPEEVVADVFEHVTADLDAANAASTVTETADAEPTTGASPPPQPGARRKATRAAKRSRRKALVDEEAAEARQLEAELARLMSGDVPVPQATEGEVPGEPIIELVATAEIPVELERVDPDDVGGTFANAPAALTSDDVEEILLLEAELARLTQTDDQEPAPLVIDAAPASVDAEIAALTAALDTESGRDDAPVFEIDVVASVAPSGEQLFEIESPADVPQNRWTFDEPVSRIDPAIELAADEGDARSRPRDAAADELTRALAEDAPIPGRADEAAVANTEIEPPCNEAPLADQLAVETALEEAIPEAAIVDEPVAAIVDEPAPEALTEIALALEASTVEAARVEEPFAALLEAEPVSTHVDELAVADLAAERALEEGIPEPAISEEFVEAIADEPVVAIVEEPAVDALAEVVPTLGAPTVEAVRAEEPIAASASDEAAVEAALDEMVLRAAIAEQLVVAVAEEPVVASVEEPVVEALAEVEPALEAPTVEAAPVAEAIAASVLDEGAVETALEEAIPEPAFSEELLVAISEEPVAASVPDEIAVEPAFEEAIPEPAISEELLVAISEEPVAAIVEEPVVEAVAEEPVVAIADESVVTSVEEPVSEGLVAVEPALEEAIPELAISEELLVAISEEPVAASVPDEVAVEAALDEMVLRAAIAEQLVVAVADEPVVAIVEEPAVEALVEIVPALEGPTVEAVSVEEPVAASVPDEIAVEPAFEEATPETAISEELVAALADEPVVAIVEEPVVEAVAEEPVSEGLVAVAPALEEAIPEPAISEELLVAISEEPVAASVPDEVAVEAALDEMVLRAAIAEQLVVAVADEPVVAIVEEPVVEALVEVTPALEAPTVEAAPVAEAIAASVPDEIAVEPAFEEASPETAISEELVAALADEPVVAIVEEPVVVPVAEEPVVALVEEPVEDARPVDEFPTPVAEEIARLTTVVPMSPSVAVPTEPAPFVFKEPEADTKAQRRKRGGSRKKQKRGDPSAPPVSAITPIPETVGTPIVATETRIEVVPAWKRGAGRSTSLHLVPPAAEGVPLASAATPADAAVMQASPAEGASLSPTNIAYAMPPSQVEPPPAPVESVYSAGAVDVVPPAEETEVERAPATLGVLRPGDGLASQRGPRPAPVPEDSPAAARAQDPARAVRLEAPLFQQAPATGLGWRKVAAAAVFVFALGGAAFGAYWYTRPPQKGTLLVESNVPGIEVVVDGRSSGVSPLALELAPGRHTVEMKGLGITRSFPVEISPGVQTTQYVKWARGAEVGRLRVTSTPEGARVFIDGELRGTTPLDAGEVTVGTHRVVLEHETGSVRGTVRVGTNEQAELDLQIYSGWVAVFAPIELRIFSQGRLIGTTNDGRIMMKPGTHQLELVNASLGYRQVRTIEVTPGRVTALSLEEAKSTLQVQAPDGTEVLVDGEPVGVTPLGNLSVTVGTHVVVFRHPQQGERRVTVSVSMNAPARAQMP